MTTDLLDPCCSVPGCNRESVAFSPPRPYRTFCLAHSREPEADPGPDDPNPAWRLPLTFSVELALAHRRRDPAPPVI